MPEMVSTRSFTLAVYAKGSKSSSRCALVLPGRLDTKDYAHMRRHVDFLASEGFFALSFDPPGTWESPGSIGSYTMTNYLLAVHEIIDELGNKPTVLLGHSRGGSIALLAGLRNPYVSHIIPVFSLTRFPRPGSGTADQALLENGYQVEYRDLPPNDTANQKIFHLPLGFFEDAAQYNILKELGDCAKPKLFLLGTRDTMATPAAVREAYGIAASPKMLYELDSDHDYRYHQHLIEEINKVTTMFVSTQA